VKKFVSIVYLSIGGVNGLIGLSPFSIYKLAIYEQLVRDSDCHIVQLLFYLQQTCIYLHSQNKIRNTHLTKKQYTRHFN